MVMFACYAHISNSSDSS
uniref:Uncharacterized protein n=1 Tax=Arundo donax TaxID=35708 RepID=A0A0A9CGS4_ARUDO